MSRCKAASDPPATVDGPAGMARGATLDTGVDTGVPAMLHGIGAQTSDLPPVMSLDDILLTHRSTDAQYAFRFQTADG